MKLYEENSQTALEWLRDLHYQICNGGIAQACYNGYVDDVIDAYGNFESWVEQLKNEVDESTKEGEMAIKAATMIANKVKEIPLTQNCGYCGGSGYTTYEDENEDGEYVTEEETCSECNGEGTIEVDDYKDADFEDNGWDDSYYQEIDLDTIDDLTKQSHTHSVVLDAIKGVKENMDIKVAKQILNENGYLVESVGENKYRITFRTECYVQADSEDEAENVFQNIPQLYDSEAEELYDMRFIEVNSIEDDSII